MSCVDDIVWELAQGILNLPLRFNCREIPQLTLFFRRSPHLLRLAETFILFFYVYQHGPYDIRGSCLSLRVHQQTVTNQSERTRVSDQLMLCEVKVLFNRVCSIRAPSRGYLSPIMGHV